MSLLNLKRLFGRTKPTESTSQQPSLDAPTISPWKEDLDRLITERLLAKHPLSAPVEKSPNHLMQQSPPGEADPENKAQSQPADFTQEVPPFNNENQGSNLEATPVNQVNQENPKSNPATPPANQEESGSTPDTEPKRHGDTSITDLKTWWGQAVVTWDPHIAKTLHSGDQQKTPQKTVKRWTR